MGRLIIFLLSLAIFLLVILLTSKLMPLGGRKKLTHEEKRKSFDADIEEVAKRIKMK